LAVIAISSADFVEQDGDTAKLPANPFCSQNVTVSYPITNIIEHNGTNIHPFYKWISNNLGEQAIPTGYYYKYIITNEGDIVDWFSDDIGFDSPIIQNTIEQNLPQDEDIL
jgi:glutathione peroxidase-family protein